MGADGVAGGEARARGEQRGRVGGLEVGTAAVIGDGDGEGGTEVECVEDAYCL